MEQDQPGGTSRILTNRFNIPHIFDDAEIGEQGVRQVAIAWRTSQENGLYRTAHHVRAWKSTRVYSSVLSSFYSPINTLVRTKYQAFAVPALW
jgi:hypothetical protein